MDVLVLTGLTFALVATIILTGYYAATAESAVEQRLKAISERPMMLASRRTRRVKRDQTLGRRMLAVLGQFGFGGDEVSLSESLMVAGIRGANATRLFVGLRTLVSVIPALVLLVPAVAQGRPLGRTLLSAFAVWAMGHMVVNMLLRRRARMRRRQIGEALPDSLDLMVVCLEAGLGLNATIARVGDERSHLNDPLGNEFAQVAAELREGRSREDSLRALGARNGVDDLKALVALVIQSDKLGASMGDTLRVHADMLRTKRRQRLEEQARKLPIKMLFPLALFVLPPLFVITLGPALLRMREFFSHMGPNH